MPGTRTTSRDNAGHLKAALRDMTVNYNKAVLDLDMLRMGLSNDTLLAWTSVAQGAGVITPMAVGSTTQNVATGSFSYTIAGVTATKAAVAAGTALAGGTIPASKWGVYAFDVVSGGALSCAAGAANFTTGYATEALAIAAVPKVITAKARIGYVTVLASASTFIGGTDALAGAAGGNPATTTNYYPTYGIATPTGDRNYVGGANGVLVATELARGSTDTRVGYTALTICANGIVNIAVAASAAGTAFGALGTIPINTWGLIVLYVNAAGVVTFGSAPQNYSTGYVTEAAAKKDLVRVAKPAGVVRIGYVTIQTKVGTTFVVGTDALAGGASGNVANATNYYVQTGAFGGIGTTQPYQQGMQAAEIGDGISSGIDADLSVSAFSQLISSGGT